MLNIKRWFFVTSLLVGLSAGQHQEQQCAHTKKTHLTLARLRDAARLMLNQFPIDSADRCYNLCCQWNSDGSHCNAAVFTPSSSDDSNIDDGGKCTLLDCQPTFDNCVWTWSPLAGSSVSRVVRINQTPRTQKQHQNLLLSEQRLPHEPSDMFVDDITTITNSSRYTEKIAEPTGPLGSVSMSLTPVASTTQEPTTAGNGDDASNEDYDYDNIQQTTIATLTTITTAAAVSSQFSTVGEDDDDVTWHLASGTLDNADEHQNQTVASMSSESSSLLPTSSTPVVDVLDEVVADEENITSSVPVQSATDTDVDNRGQSSPTSFQSSPSWFTKPFNYDSGEDDSDEWKPKFTKGRSKSLGSDSYDGDGNTNDELIIGAGSLNDETNSIKMTAFLLPSSDSSEDRRSLQASVFFLVTISLATIMGLLVIIVGCRKVCSDRPRYIALRDDTPGSTSDFQTNYLVSQPSSLYRASLLDK